MFDIASPGPRSRGFVLMIAAVLIAAGSPVRASQSASDIEPGRGHSTFIYNACLSAIIAIRKGDDLAVAKALALQALDYAGDDESLRTLAETTLVAVVLMHEGLEAAQRQLAKATQGEKELAAAQGQAFVAAGQDGRALVFLEAWKKTKGIQDDMTGLPKWAAALLKGIEERRGTAKVIAEEKRANPPAGVGQRPLDAAEARRLLGAGTALAWLGIAGMPGVPLPDKVIARAAEALAAAKKAPAAKGDGAYPIWLP